MIVAKSSAGRNKMEQSAKMNQARELNEGERKMKQILRNDRIWLALIAIFAGAALPARAEVTCTATPDCAGLGYTKSASQCPDGGVKCPFDASKMFCVASGDVDFTFKSSVGYGNIVYSDGTTSSYGSYNANKLAIGMVYFVHQNKKSNHGLIISLDQPVAATRAEAIKRCAGYSTKGTKAGDWHLPDFPELTALSDGNATWNNYSNMQSYLYSVPGAMTLGYSFSASYQFKSSAADYYNGKSYLNSKPAYSGNTIYNVYDSPYYWSRSDDFSTPSSWLYAQLNSGTGLYAGAVSTHYGHYRCVAEF